MKKFIFILIIFILGMYIAYVSYSGYKYESIAEVTNKAVSDKNFVEVAKIFGGCFDTNPIFCEEKDDVDVALFNGTSILDVTYGDERTYAYENTYYVYFLDVNFEYQTYEGDKNSTALKFYSDSGSTYTYPFVVNDSINSGFMNTDEISKESAVLSSSRDVTMNMKTWNFMYINITKTMVDAVTKQMGGQSINGFYLIDNQGDEVINVSIDLNFSQEFFSNSMITGLITEYNKWLYAYAKNEKANAAKKEFDKFYEVWEEEFNSNELGYTLPYDSKYLVPAKVVWKTIGSIGLYAVIMSFFYILFFHFSIIKNILNSIAKLFKKKNKDASKIKKTKTLKNKEDNENFIENDIDKLEISSEKVNNEEVDINVDEGIEKIK